MEFVCAQCPRGCRAARGAERPGDGKGFCKMGRDACVARLALHFDEEPCISGTGGSGAVFFSGCALRCVYCQNEKISHNCFGETVSDAQLRAGFDRLIAKGAVNINLVNPTHYAHLLYALLDGSLPAPVVWNTGGYERPETIRRFEGRVQVYLPDLKYISPELSARYSGAPDYFRWASESIREMLRQTGPAVLDENGVMQRGTMVRHLVLPGQAEESIRVLDWIAENLPGAWVSLMAQYLPCSKALKIPELNRRVAAEEYERVAEHLYALGLEDGYVQEMESADSSFIPPFDLTGVEA